MSSGQLALIGAIMGLIGLTMLLVSSILGSLQKQGFFQGNSENIDDE